MQANIFYSHDLEFYSLHVTWSVFKLFKRRGTYLLTNVFLQGKLLEMIGYFYFSWVLFYGTNVAYIDDTFWCGIDISTLSVAAQRTAFIRTTTQMIEQGNTIT